MHFHIVRHVHTARWSKPIHSVMRVAIEAALFFFQNVRLVAIKLAWSLQSVRPVAIEATLSF